MPDSAWLLTANRANWFFCAQAKSFGIKSQPGRLKAAQVGDPLVAYVAGEGVLAGLGTITRELYYEESAIWSDDLYPHRVGIEVQLDFEQTLDVRALVAVVLEACPRPIHIEVTDGGQHIEIEFVVGDI